MKHFWQTQILQAEYYSEGDIQTKLISSLLPFLGYSTNEWRQDTQTHSAILVGEASGERFEPFFFIETKELGTNLDLFLPQFSYRLMHYFNSLGLNYGVLCNGKNFQLYRCDPGGKLICLLNLRDLRSTEALNQINQLLARELFTKASRTSRAHVISIYNNKGGVGKTTLSINLSAALSHLGYKVLLVDLDAQANSTLGLGLYPPHTEDRNIVAFLEKYPRIEFSKLIWRDVNHNGIDLVPANINLYQALREFQGRDFVLKEELDQLTTESYDFVVLDTPPAMDRCFNFSVRAADFMVIPSDLKPFSIYGLTHLVRETDQQLKILGVVGNNIDLATNISEPLREIKENHNLMVFDQIIHTRACISQATGLGMSIFQMNHFKKGNAASVAATEFKTLVRQILAKIEGICPPKPIQSKVALMPVIQKTHTQAQTWTIKSNRFQNTPDKTSFNKELFSSV
ncbi:MAG: AAA family ATPase [Candidatus Caenarcaniphilales bacterium]|nr:AAA family ATPase [Candidatus Caenarcaniphilales bacterium]